MFRRFKIIQLHMLFASFLFPIAVLYIVSGALYTFGVKGHVEKQVFTLTLENPFEPNLALLTKIVTKALEEKKLVLPGGDPYVTKSKGVYKFRWKDLKYSVILVANKQRYSADLTYRKRSVLTQLMRIHRGVAGDKFKLLSIIATAGLLFTFVTGLYMAFRTTKHRYRSLLAMILGLLTFFVVLFV